MKSFIWQFVGAAIIFLLILVVINTVGAPGEFSFNHKEIKKQETITLAFVGDVMLGRNVEVLMEIHGKDYPFAYTDEIFDKADFVVANLEGPIPDNHMHTKSGELKFSFPSFVPELLQEKGIDAVSLANNHTLDQGKASYQETVNALAHAEVSSFGHPTIQSASYAQNFLLNEVPFTLIGFNSTFPTFELSEAAAAVREAKEVFPEGKLIVMMHWGNEYELTSSDEQKSIARALHNAGVDLIIGAHPHVVQEVECQNLANCTIYSLGNFIFDQYFDPEVEKGLVAYVTLSKNNIENIEFLSIEGNHSQPRISGYSR